MTLKIDYEKVLDEVELNGVTAIPRAAVCRRNLYNLYQRSTRRGLRGVIFNRCTSGDVLVGFSYREITRRENSDMSHPHI